VGILHTLAVSYSRIILGVHYPRDVIGGVIVGVLIVAGAYRFLYTRWKLPHWIIISSIIVLVLGSAALSWDPGYDSAIRLTGIGLGALMAGIAYLLDVFASKPLLEPVPRQVRAMSLGLLVLGLLIAYVSEKTMIGGLIGYAILAFLVFTGRPLACMATGCLNDRISLSLQHRLEPRRNFQD